MKKKLIWAAIGLVVLLLIGGGIVAATFKMPEFVGLDGIEIQELEGKDLHAVVKGKISNANFFELTARKLDYIVTYHDTLIGRGKLPEGFELAAGDTTELELPVKMELQAIFAVYKSMLAKDKCPLDIHLEGEFTRLHHAHGLDLQTEIEPEKFIKDIVGGSMGNSPIKFEDLSWKTSDFQNSEFTFVSVVKNPLDIPLEMKALTLFFYSESNLEDPAGNWKLDAPVPLKANYSTRIPGTVKIKHLEAGKSIVKTIFTGEIRYATKGTVTLQIAKLPFDIPIEGTMVIDPKSGKGKWE